MKRRLRWRPSGKQYSMAIGTLILISQTFNGGPEKPTLILAALGLFFGTPLVMRIDEHRESDRNGDKRNGDGKHAGTDDGAKT